MRPVVLLRRIEEANKKRYHRITVCHYCDGEERSSDGRCLHCGAYAFEHVFVRNEVCTLALK